ncbi:MAG TPA: tyrosine--tRNA ligase [Myxococcota bacterium]|jgi:tyrosyl-tRNA synthetase|nr:tyrosine--tRNA ligase [Myxococcota bacterium]
MGFRPAEEQLATLKLGAVSLETEAELLAKLREGRPLRVKAGFDPTTADLHLGHTLVMRKMAQFQQLGHLVDFVIGDHTALIGDPSGRDTTRPVPTPEEVARNARTYTDQAFKVLDREKTRVRFNSEWLGKMSFEDVIRLAGKYTVSRMLERNDFKKRLDEGAAISVHELLYPLAQAYDSVALQTDVELGGDDQYFNLNVGRDVMRRYGLPAQCLLTTPLLEGLDGVKKMSKSVGNYVGVDEAPFDMLSKLLSVSDELMWRYYALLSLVGPDELERRRRGHPLEAKMALAKEMVERYHGAAAAAAAEGDWRARFQKHEVPDEMRAVALDAAPLARLLAAAGLCDSVSEGRRLLAQGAVSIDGAREKDANRVLAAGTYVLKVGKLRFARVTVR